MPLVEPVPGRFCWFELGTTDTASGFSFYRTIFGWTPTEVPMAMGGVYTIFKIGDQDVAAGYELTAEMRGRGVPPHWMLYVSVRNADAAAAKAASLGATVIQPPIDVGPNGRLSVLVDPTGAMFTVWRGAANPGVRLVGDPGTVVWADLNTGDQMRAMAFYGQLFGWKLVDGKNMAVAKAGEYGHIVNGDQFIGGIQPAEYLPPNTPPHWLIYFEVADCDATLEQIRSLGGRVHMEPMEMKGVRRFAVAADPQGASFALVQHLQHV